MQVGTNKDQGLYNKPSAAVHPGELAAGTLAQYKYNVSPEENGWSKYKRERDRERDMAKLSLSQHSRVEVSNAPNASNASKRLLRLEAQLFSLNTEAPFSCFNYLEFHFIL